MRAEQLVTAFDVIADGLAVVDPDGRIVYVNWPLCELFGYEPSELIGEFVEVLVPSEIRGRHSVDRAGYAADRDGRPMGRVDLDIEGRHATGRHIPVDIQLARLPQTDLTVATIRDMTSQRRAAVDHAVDRLDLQAARQWTERLIESHDLAVQRLFALGAHLAAQAARSAPDDDDRFLAAAGTISDLIVSIRSAAFGAGPLDDHGSSS